MRLGEIFLPLADNEGNRFDHRTFSQLESELAERFGGVTVHPRSGGIWKDSDSATKHDDLVVFEVMTEEIEPDWWKGYRKTLENLFRQEQIVIRAYKIDLL